MDVLKCVLIVLVALLEGSFSDERGPRMRIMTRQMKAETLTLPSNATSIRENITDNFSCESRSYGYYADVENDCQIFHVCLPVTYSNGKNQTFRWSFICPDETIFNQEVFVCVREEDSTINCEESEDYYSLNDSFGDKEVEEEVEVPEEENQMEMEPEKMETPSRPEAENLSNDNKETKRKPNPNKNRN